MPFEYFVRPFQSKDNFGRTIVPSNPSGHERATLTWGAKTSALPMPERAGKNVECCSEHLHELERKTETARIGDLVREPQNYLVVQRTTEIKFQKKTESTCASDWNQMSGVASAVEKAFSDLEADIEAQGSFADVDHCHQVFRMQPNTEQIADPFAAGPYP